MEGAGGSGEPSRSAREQRQGAAIARQLARELRQSTTLFAQQEPHLAASGQNSPRTPDLSPHVRYKTLPARPKWPNLAQSTHAGRVLYRSHHQEAKQGEFCTERKAEIELANTTALQAPQVRSAPAKPEGQAAVPVDGGRS